MFINLETIIKFNNSFKVSLKNYDGRNFDKELEVEEHWIYLRIYFWHKFFGL